MVEEETIVCVENLKLLAGQKKIIVVDNCSPNNSGKKIQDLYADDSEIVFLLNPENFGFAKGNNAGCEMAKNMFNPDYYVVINNDVEIIQNDFISRIEKIDRQEHFDILSPDIYSTTGKVHQSPKNLKNITLEKARRLQRQYNKKMNSKVIVPLRCYLKQIWFLRLIYNKKKNDNLQIDYTKKYYNVPLHGSCFVFSRKFMQQRSDAFFPNTFFYFESEILDYECQLHGWKEVYDPSLKVCHHQNISTNYIYKKALDKVRFMNQQNYNSITAFLNIYDK